MITAMAALLGALLMVPALATAAPEKILILPFTIHAEKDMAFLNQGIVSMLGSRLAKPGQRVTEAVTQLPDAPKKIVELARSRGAKYYTTGSLTLFGNSVSTDARLIETDTGKTLVAYNQYGERAGDVLAHMDAFARQVDAQLSGGATPKAAAPASAPAVAVSSVTPTSPPAVAAPAAVAATVVAAGTAAAVAAPKASAPVPAAPATQATPSLPTPGVKMSVPMAAPVVSTVDSRTDITFFESQVFGEEIRSLTTGDINGDGLIEIVFTSANRISVYQFDKGKLIPLGGFNSPREYTIISVDALDVNGNGKSEIFVARILDMAQSRDTGVRQWGLDSIVLESDNNRLTEIATGLKYYFRKNTTSDGRTVMTAQRRAMVGTYGEQSAALISTGSLFLGGAFELIWKNGVYTPGDLQPVPKKLSLFDYTLGDITNGGGELITTVNSSSYLTLLEPDGRKKWSARDRFGETAVYLEFPSIEGTSQMDRYYIRQRMFILDLDGDGENELVLANNQDLTRELLARVRDYQNGVVTCMAWGKRSLQIKWETEELGGYIADLAVADLNGNGQKELIYAVVDKTKSSFSDGESFIVIQKPPNGGGKAS